VSESTLSVTRADLTREVSRYLGFTTTFASLSSNEQSLVNDIVKSGERQFYGPPPIPGEKLSHVWSFSTPTLSVSILANVTDYDLPDDFGGFTDNMLHFTGSDNAWLPVKLTGVGKILQLRQQEDATTTIGGQPELAATQLLPSDHDGGQRHQLMVWPTPGSSYTLKGVYYSSPNAVADATPYPLGGQPHADTIRQSCLAAAEQNANDTRGIEWQKFIERLVWSVSFDRRMNTPKFFGKNLDRSCGVPYERRRSDYVTYEGSL
jgi:hypothetical protein